MKVGFISLGCSKNLIDTEVLIGKFKQNNYQIVNDEKEAEILIINTCGFIESAKEEAINTIFEMSRYKERKCKYLIVMGCLVQRYYAELVKEIPEVDLFLRLDEYDKMWEKVERLFNINKIEITNPISRKEMLRNPLPMFCNQEFLEREITTGKNYAYLKIGEGCSNRCTYCAIPYIRGTFKSRPKEDIIAEARGLVQRGIKEIILIAQDTTKYGIDIYGKSLLHELLNEIAKINEVKIIRFLYSYPEGITDELIEEVSRNDKVAKYFDIPIQHISNSILKKMNRRTSRENIEEIIYKIKKQIPDVVLRTSLIVGFPGETKEEFEELDSFVDNIGFDKLGVFKYSKEEGTPAEKMPNQIHFNTKRGRYNKIMKTQQKVSRNKLENKLNKEKLVLIENITFDNKFFVGRSKEDVPDIDGLVYIENDGKYKYAEVLNIFKAVNIVDYSDYDLIGKFT